MSTVLRRMRINIFSKFKVNRFSIPKKSKLILYSSGILLTTGFCVSSMSETNYVLAQSHPDIANYFHAVESLRELAPIIDAPGMLHGFLDELKSGQNAEGLFSADFVRQLLTQHGIEDKALIDHLIDMMDWNKNDKLTKYEVAALFTLFNVGPDVERYRFLFQCLDLNRSGNVKKDEFRQILTCLLEAKYHLFGLENRRDPDEIYYDIEPDEYHTMAKFAANQLVRKIFTYADQKKRGKLSWPEFLHWCSRGGNEVLTLKELLHQTHDESAASEIVYKYKVGYMPEMDSSATMRM